MDPLFRKLGLTMVIAISGSVTAFAGDDDSRRERDAYAVTPLVSNLSGHAEHMDAILQNAWGIAFSPAGSPFWVNDNATGCSTLYDGTGVKITALQVSIPLPGNIVPATSCQPKDPNKPSNPTPAAPTGIVWNPAASFLVPGTKIPAVFIFSTEDGTISAWAGGLNPRDNAVIAADESANGSVYKALAYGVNAKGAFLFAAIFHNGTVDVFGPNGPDGQFTMVTSLDGHFTDPEIPGGYAPFNIANIDGDLFVTYAKQNAQKHDDVAGAGHGFVDVFDTDGHLLRRFESRGRLNSPWGITRASFAFGPYSGDPVWSVDILVSQREAHQEIFGYLQKDAVEGFPVRPDPMASTMPRLPAVRPPVAAHRGSSRCPRHAPTPRLPPRRQGRPE